MTKYKGFSKQKEIHDMNLPISFASRIINVSSEAECNAHYHGGGNYVTSIQTKNNAVMVTISDKGKGISDLDKAFKSNYSTATNEIKDMGPGMGCGMCVMKEDTDYLNIKTGENGTVVTMIFVPRFTEIDGYLEYIQ